MKAENRFKSWTLEDVRAVVNHPKIWGWSKEVAKDLGRSPKSVTWIDTAFNAWTKGDNRYCSASMIRHFLVVTNPVKNAQTDYYKSVSANTNPEFVPFVEATGSSASPIRPVGTPSAIVGEIEKNMEKMQGLFMKLGDAIVREQYGHVNRELEQKETIINDQAREIERLEKLVREQEHQGKFDLKSYFNIK